jgi:TolB-like protein/AraC-like DNA-binding protein
MIPGTGNENELLERLTQITLENLENENFGGTELAMLAGMSISTLNRRLHKISSKPTSQFIREIRLKKAMELLMQQNDTVAEVAWKVGFGSPAYFSKCFHDFYGFPPGEAIKREMNITEPETITGSLLPESEQDKRCSTHRRKSKSNTKKVFYYAFTAFFLLAPISLLLYNLFFADSVKQAQLAASEKSIIVLPFKNFTNDPTYQYFADGITEDILNKIYNINTLRVVSRTSAEQFREGSLSVSEIARLMNISYVLEGSVRRYQNKTRISVQLIDAKNDNHLWSANYDRELTDILDIQDNVAFEVARNLDAVLSEKEIKDIEKKATKNPEAYDFYLRARFLLHKANSNQRADFGRTGALNCIQYYEKAIAADTTFAEAYAGLANAWFNLSAWGFLPAYEGFTKARIYSKKALEYDPICAEAHAVTGALFIWGGGRNIEEGSKELKKAVNLNPNFSTAHQWYAQSLMITGPIEEARFHVNRALELEPYFWVVQTLSSWIYYFEKKYDMAIEDSRIARDLNPDFIDNNWLFVLNYAKLDEGEKMIQELQSIIKKFTRDETYLDEVQVAFEKNGINGIFSWLIDVNNNKPVPVEGMDGHPFYSAWWNAILGNKDEVIYWLEQSLEYPRPLGHYSYLITTNPDFDIMRNDPRFLVIIEKMGLTPYHTRVAKE